MSNGTAFKKYAYHHVTPSQSVCVFFFFFKCPGLLFILYHTIF